MKSPNNDNSGSFTEESYIQRRMNVKVPMNVKTYIIHTFKNAESETVREKIYLNLRDLSAGGICFAADIDFPEDDEYELVFARGKQPVVVKFQILRKMAEPEGGFSYGCSFVDTDIAEEQVIREYVFKKQLL